MGKPSSTTISKKSDHSLMSCNSIRKMNGTRKEIKTQRRKQKQKNKKIKNLFKKLRNESSSCWTDYWDSTSDNTVICLENSAPGPSKRKCSPAKSVDRSKMRKTNSNIIVITDDEANSKVCDTPKKQPSPINCSTPLANKTNSIKDLNVSNVSPKNNNCMLENFNKEVKDLTLEINNSSYLTIDLTTDTLNRTSQYETVSDLNNVSDSQDCILVSTSNASMSGNSDVTVLRRPMSKKSEEKQIRRVANGIARLDASSKGKLLELITQKIFNGCNVPNNLKDMARQTKSTETAEDTYIKEVILGQCSSRNSIGSNIYNPEKDAKNRTGLRMVVIDGSNVAMEHAKGRGFSVKGLKICIDYFLKRGHCVKAFVPRFRCKFGKSSEPRLLAELERRGLVVYTPSREVKGKMITSYDDRYIVQCAAEFDAVIVSGDNYRDLLQENPRWRFIIENRLLPFTWVDDMIMFPRDPLGRNGPTLEKFLRHTKENTIVLR